MIRGTVYLEFPWTWEGKEPPMQQQLDRYLEDMVAWAIAKHMHWEVHQVTVETRLHCSSCSIPVDPVEYTPEPDEIRTFNN